jgi:hypothetical protein
MLRAFVGLALAVLTAACSPSADGTDAGSGAGPTSPASEFGTLRDAMVAGGWTIEEAECVTARVGSVVEGETETQVLPSLGPGATGGWTEIVLVRPTYMFVKSLFDECGIGKARIDEVYEAWNP